MLASPRVKRLKLAVAAPLYAIHPNKPAFARWLRREVQTAGCAFVKVGQWVSTRTDIFPHAITSEFASLRTQVPPMSADAVRQVLEESYGAPPHTIFSTFDPTPVSSGSIAQVHRATLLDDPTATPVAVKVQRPGLLRELSRDAATARAIVWPYKLVNRKLYEDVVASIDDLCATVRRELDFEEEARHMARFAAGLRGVPKVKVPTVVARHSTDRVIVMEYVPSSPVTDPATCPRLMELFMTQLFQVGYVHSDMHAGNLGALEDGTLVLYDFGSVQQCPENLSTCIKYLMVSYLRQDPAERMLDYMLEFGVLRDAASPGSAATLGADSRVMLVQFVRNVLAYVETTDIQAFARGVKTIPMPEGRDGGNVIEFQPEIFLLFRTFTLVEGLCKDLDPNFVILDTVAPFAAAMFITDPGIYAAKVDDDLRAVAAWFDNSSSSST